MKRKKRKARNKVKFSKLVIAFSLFLFALMIGRLTQLALSSKIDGVDLKSLASKRTTRTEVLTAKRGNIYSTNGDVLAQNIASYKLIAYLDPRRSENQKTLQHVEDKDKTARELAPILGMSYEEVFKYLSKEGVYQTEFGSKGKGLNEITKNKIEDLKLPGLDFIQSYKRYYPKGDFASYTIGYAKTSSDDETGEEETTGEMGIEKSYDNLLKGEDGYVTYQKDLRGYKIADTKEDRKEAVEGKDVYLTIDSNVQFFVEQALKKSQETYGFEWFNMTVADAKTGAILATAQAPSFDLNQRNMTNYLNYTVSSPYEPGSTMKTFTYMAAMENGVYNGAETYKSGVYVTSDGTEIGDWKREGWGVISFDKGYALSSNVGIINLISRHMNSTMLRLYFRKLGFGKKTGVQLPFEETGSLNFKYETEVFNAGFGQGITTTPMQNIQALTCLTNDGILLKPYIVSKIVDPATGEVIFEGRRKELERVASTQTVEKMKQLMDDTVNGVGNTGSGYRMDGYNLIGKTGTAQIADENSGGYLAGEDQIISSFTGIYPKDDPEIIIYASVKRPGGGNQKAIWDAVKDVVANVAKYHGHEPVESTHEKVVKYKMPSFTSKKVENVRQNLNMNGINDIVVLGSGNKVIKQYPKSGDTISSKDKVYLVTNGEDVVVPNVVGLSSKEATQVLRLLGLKVKLEGKGYVVSQSIVDRKANALEEILLKLNPKFDASG